MSADALNPSRRRFLQVFLAAPIVLAAGMRPGWPDLLAAAEAARRASPPDAKPGPPGRALALTPDCGDDDEPTPPAIEGPFFTPRSPRRTSLLEPGLKGNRMVVTGRVFSRDCRPLSDVLLDFWHADRDGEYDNQGFRLRGHQFTDGAGRYRLETIVPGQYPGRTRHIHVKVQAPEGRILTTQLFFPGEARNRSDFVFRPDLLLAVREGEGARQARFHFVLDLA